MHATKLISYPLAAIVLVTSLFGATYLLQIEEVVVQGTGTVTVSIGSVTFSDVAIDGDTVLSILTLLDATHPDMQLMTKEYEGLGTLVTSLYGRTNGYDGAYWQYKVNDIPPQVGAGAYPLSNGDQVVWEFKSSEF